MTLEDEHDRVMTLMKNLLQFFSNTNIVTPDQIKNVSWLWVLWLKKVEKLKSCGTPSLWNVKRFVSLKTVFFSSALFNRVFNVCLTLFPISNWIFHMPIHSWKSSPTCVPAMESFQSPLLWKSLPGMCTCKVSPILIVMAPRMPTII